MSQQDPWANFRTKSPGQPQPVQTPGLPSLPIRDAQTQAAQQGIILNANQDARAQQALELQIANAARDAAKADRDAKAAELNSGVDTTASQDQAAGHAVTLTTALGLIKETLAKDKSAQKPGWRETLARGTGNDILTGYAQSGNRQVMDTAYKAAIDSAVWLSTGAAAPADQVERISGTLVPTLMDKPENLAAKRLMLKARIAEARVRAGPANAKVNEALSMLEGSLDEIYGPLSEEATPGTDPSTGLPVKTINDIPQETGTRLASDRELNPFPAEAQAEFQQWIKEKGPTATPQDMWDFYKLTSQRYGVIGGPEAQGSMGEMTPEWAAGAEAYLDHFRKHPNAQPGSLNWEKELSSFDKAREAGNQAIAPVVTALASAGDAMSAGIIPELLPTENKNNFEAYKDQNPKTALVGDLVGSVGAVTGLEGLAAKGFAKTLGREAPALAQIGANAGYGAVRGAMDAGEGNRTSGALFGGGLAGIGATGARAITQGSRGFISPKTAKALDELKDVEGLTVLQKAGAGKVEETFQGLPIIRGAREKAEISLNQSNINRALKNVGQKLPEKDLVGTEANEAASRILGKEYETIRPKIKGDLDGTFQTTLAAIDRQIPRTKNHMMLFQEIRDTMRGLASGKYDGNSFKDIDQRLRLMADDWARKSGDGDISNYTYHEMSRVANQYRKALRLQVARNTPEVAGKLKALDKAYAHLMRIENATGRAITRGNAEGIYSPREYMASIKQLDRTKNRSASSRGQALDQKFAQAAQKIMGSKPIPETSNFRDILIAAYLAAKNPGKAAAMTTAAAGVYMPGVKKLTNFILNSKRPAVADKLTNFYAQALARGKADRDKHPETKKD